MFFQILSVNIRQWTISLSRLFFFFQDYKVSYFIKKTVIRIHRTKQETKLLNTEWMRSPLIKYNKLYQFYMFVRVREKNHRYLAISERCTREWSIYLASKSFSLARGLAFMKSFASLVSRVVGLFYTPGAFTKNKATTWLKYDGNDFVKAQSHAREKPLHVG